MNVWSETCANTGDAHSAACSSAAPLVGQLLLVSTLCVCLSVTGALLRHVYGLTLREPSGVPVWWLYCVVAVPGLPLQSGGWVPGNTKRCVVSIGVLVRWEENVWGAADTVSYCLHRFACEHYAGLARLVM